MRSQPDRLYDITDGACLDQLARFDGAAILEALAVHDRVDPSGRSLHATNVCELLQRDDAGLVHHIILAMLHHADAERGALVRNDRREHKLDRGVLQDLTLIADLLRLRIPARELRAQVGLDGMEGDQLTTTPDGGVHLTVDVAVIHADDGEAEPWLNSASTRGVHGGRNRSLKTSRCGEPRGHAGRGFQHVPTTELLHRS